MDLPPQPAPAPAPLAVLLGWWGARPHHLAKYEALYTTQPGFRVVQYTAPTSVLMGGRAAQDAAARELLLCCRRRVGGVGDATSNPTKGPNTTGAAPALEAAARAPAAVVVHTFSNNGCIMFLALQRVARHDPQRHGWFLAGLRGVVLDSCPGQLSAWVGLRAFLANRPPPAVRLAVLGLPALALGWLLRLALRRGRHRPLSTAAVVALVIGGAWLLNARRNATYHRAVAVAGPRCPHLFLYSEADALVSHAVVESVAAAQQRHWKATAAAAVVGRAVPESKLHKFAGSAHVAHMRAHPDEYAAAVHDFLSGACGGELVPRAGRPCAGVGSGRTARRADARPPGVDGHPAQQ